MDDGGGKMMRLALAVLLSMYVNATLAQSSLVFRTKNGDGSPVVLRLHFTPCADETVIAHLVRLVRPEFLTGFQAATFTWRGRDWKACWLEHDGSIYSFDEEGAPFNPPHGVPRGMFRGESI